MNEAGFVMPPPLFESFEPVEEAEEVEAFNLSSSSSKAFKITIAHTKKSQLNFHFISNFNVKVEKRKFQQNQI